MASDAVNHRSSHIKKGQMHGMYLTFFRMLYGSRDGPIYVFMSANPSSSCLLQQLFRLLLFGGQFQMDAQAGRKYYIV